MNSPKNKINVAIIDYEMGNLFSVQHACRNVGLNPIITNNNNILSEAHAAILPGVGAYKTAMDNLSKLDLINPIKDFIISGKPFLGICLGLQLLFTESEEFGHTKGLDIISGSVKKFPTYSELKKKIKIPQVGWNRIKKPANLNGHWNRYTMKDIKDDTFMYFVHSYYVIPENKNNILTVTDYEGIQYCSGVFNNNIDAFQFHPEKSSVEGLKIYKNWSQEIQNLVRNKE